MLTKALIITGLSVSAIGGTGLALAPQNPVDAVSLSAGPAQIQFGGEQLVTLDSASELSPGVTVTLKNGRQLSLSL